MKQSERNIQRTLPLDIALKIASSLQVRNNIQFLLFCNHNGFFFSFVLNVKIDIFIFFLKCFEGIGSVFIG